MLSRANGTFGRYPDRWAVDHRRYPGWNRDALLFLVGVVESGFAAGHWRADHDAWWAQAPPQYILPRSQERQIVT